MTSEELRIYSDRERVLEMIIDLSFELTTPIGLKVGVVPGVTAKNAVDLRTEVRELIETRLRFYAAAYLYEYATGAQNV